MSQSNPLHDFIIPLPQATINDLFLHDEQAFINPHRFLPVLPNYVKRVWIYEQAPIDAITCVLRLDYAGRPIKLYQLCRPLPLHLMVHWYNYQPRQTPAIAPLELRHNHWRCANRVW